MPDGIVFSDEAILGRMGTPSVLFTEGCLMSCVSVWRVVVSGQVEIVL